MKSKNLHSPQSLRFRRWSRAGYAVFCSLGRVVTIGCVSGFISGKSLLKAGIVSVSSVCHDDESYSGADKEQEDLEATLLQLQAPTLNQITFDGAAACAPSSFYSNQNG